MIVKLKSNESLFSDLTSQQSYVVIGIEADDFRILNDDGRPYLYPQAAFEIENSCEPEDWISELGEEGERYAYPPALNSPGFFEDFFDDDKQAIAQFWRVINQRLTMAG